MSTIIYIIIPLTSINTATVIAAQPIQLTITKNHIQNKSIALRIHFPSAYLAIITFNGCVSQGP